jgi:hypothetical protein
MSRQVFAMRSLLSALLSLHGHVIDSRRALPWCDSSACKAQDDSEKLRVVEQKTELTCVVENVASESMKF